MGKLLIFAGVILVVLCLLALWGYMLQTRADAKKRGLTGSKKQIKELESDQARHVRALKEIREIAATNEAVMGDPTWSLVASKVDEALMEENDE